MFPGFYVYSQNIKTYKLGLPLRQFYTLFTNIFIGFDARPVGNFGCWLVISDI